MTTTKKSGTNAPGDSLLQFLIRSVLAGQSDHEIVARTKNDIDNAELYALLVKVSAKVKARTS